MSSGDPRAPNVYAPPSAALDVAAEAPPSVDPGSASLASRASRFYAASLDGLLASAALIPNVVGIYRTLKAHTPLNPEEIVEDRFMFLFGSSWALVGSFLWLALLGLQSWLVARSGQSLGKKALGLRIVRQDGSPAGFLRGVVLRSWLFHLAVYVPGVKWVMFIDPLLIFGKQRRCLHDRLADTKVVDVARPTL